MKLRYILLALAAGFGLTMVSCNDGDDYELLDDLKVSKSIVSIPMDGGSDQITVNANTSWAFDESSIPDWLTLSSLSGSEGETTVSFSAAATKAGRNAQLKIKVSDTEQYINVIQGLKSAEASTCAQVIAGEDGRLYRVTATVTSIVSTSWGNMWLNDGTGEVYVYGTLDKEGKEQNFSSLGIEVGDVVTVEGPKKTYNGTVELEKVTVVKIVKSLLKVEPSEQNLTYEAADFTIKAWVKSGSKFSWSVAEGSDWLQVSSTKEVADTVFFDIHVSENAGESPRSGKISFTAAAGSQTTTQSLNIMQGVNTEKFLAGTIRKPFTVAQAIAAVDKGQTSDTYYVSGIIRKIDNVNTSFGNAQYWIADDETSEALFEVFRGLYFDSAKFTAEDQIAVGQKVVVSGKLTKYKDTYEFSAGNSLVTIDGLAAASGDGTAENPYNVAAVVGLLKAGTQPAEAVYIKGYVSSDAGVSAQYGNATYWIADSGADAKVFEVFRGMNFGGAKFTSADQLAQNDEVVVSGILTSFTDKNGKTTLETKAGAALVSRNGKSE